MFTEFYKLKSEFYMIYILIIEFISNFLLIELHLKKLLDIAFRNPKIVVIRQKM